MSECPICKGNPKADEFHGSNINVRHIECTWCGKYQISTIASAQLQQALGEKNSRRRANASGYLRDNPGITLDASSEKWLTSIPTPSFRTRVEKLMLAIEKDLGSFADPITLHSPDWLGRTWCKNPTELLYLIDYLKGSGRLVGLGGGGSQLVVKVTPLGLDFLEEIRRRTPLSQQVFVAMWFHPCMTPVYEQSMAPAIRDAGYDPKRIDKKEHFGKIDDEIIGEIRRSRFLVADFTGHRGGVYYEAGFAHGLNIPVIFTCRKKELHRLHFDVRQYVTIDWEDLEDLQKRLKDKIVGALGWGPLTIPSG
jgi:hypothetical protein